jgi:N-acetylneuraminate lyase
LFALATLITLSASVPIPQFITLHAAYTPFLPDNSVNYSAVTYLAADAANSAVNTVWVVGGMGQFDSLSVNERNALLKVWVTEGHKHNLFIIAHVGSTVQSDAISMAQYAVSVGADAIAAVPPYYQTFSNPSDLVTWFTPVLAAAPNLPFFYYHIPGSTGATVNIYDFATAAIQRLPTFKGIKYVENNQRDFLRLVTDYPTNYYWMWANEPKIQSLPYTGYGSILAESFYAGTYLRMWSAFNNDDMKGTINEQNWKYKVEDIFSKYGSNSKRWVYRQLCNVDMGLPRLPSSQQPFDSVQYQSFIQELTAVGFFNQTYPAWTPPKTF